MVAAIIHSICKNLPAALLSSSSRVAMDLKAAFAQLRTEVTSSYPERQSIRKLGAAPLLQSRSKRDYG